MTLARFPAGAGSPELEAFTRAAADPRDRDHGTDEVVTVPAAPYVRPAVVLDGSTQYVACYDADRWLTVTARPGWGWTWTRVRLPSRLGWDSHNYPSIAVDRAGHVHVAGNMHATELVYFRTRSPGDLRTLERVPVMVSEPRERRVTYPEFVRGPGGELSFWFRDGTSGRGAQWVYAYDEEGGTWRAPLDGPLIDGDGRSSAYLEGNRARVDADGYWVTWVWRDSPEAESTHSVCHAHSPDLQEWRNAAGEPLTLPIGPEAPVVGADVRPGCGLINNNVGSVRVHGRPLLVHHARDEDGRMQIRCARYTDTGWVTEALTDWDLTWDFSGRGSLVFEIEVGTPSIEGSRVVVPVRHRDRVIDLRWSAGGGDAGGAGGAGGEDGAVTARPCAPPWPGIDGVQDQHVARSLATPRIGDPGAVLWWSSRPPARDRQPEGQDLGPRPLRIGRLRADPR